MKNNNQTASTTRMQRHENKPTKTPSIVRQRHAHGFLSFLLGLVFILALALRLTLLSGPFMVQAVQSPVVVNQVHDSIATQLQAKNLPANLATNDLIKAVLKTGAKQTYAGQDVNFDVPAIQTAVTDDVNQQASNVGINAGVAGAATSTVASLVLSALTVNYQNDWLTDFAQHVHQYQIEATIVVVISGALWFLLMHRNRLARRDRRALLVAKE